MYKIISIFVVALFGCTNYYARFYNGASYTKNSESDSCQILNYHLSDEDMALRCANLEGFTLVGKSSFYSTSNGINPNDAIDVCNERGMDLLLYMQSYQSNDIEIRSQQVAGDPDHVTKTYAHTYAYKSLYFKRDKKRVENTCEKDFNFKVRK